MDGDEDDVAIEVGELDHLLHGAVDARAHQSAEFANAVVFVHNVVAHLNLVEFLEREGEFARAGLVALQVIFVEAVENLVVGEHTQLEVVVHKTLVQGVLNGFKLDVIVAVLEDEPQTLNLLGTVAQDANPVAFFNEVVERLADEVEVLVIDALRRAVERQSGIAFCGTLAMTELHAAALAQGIAEQAVIDHLVQRMGIAFFGNERAGGDGLLGDGLHALLQPVHIVANEQRVGAGKFEERGSRLGRAAIVQYVDAVELLLRELGLDIEGADAVDLVTEEVDAVRQFVTEREHIQDGAAQGKLPRLIHIIHLAETEVAQAAASVGEVECGVHLDVDGGLIHHLAGAHLLGKRLGESHYTVQFALRVPLAEHLGAQYLVGRVNLPVLDVALVARGEDEHLLVAHNLAQVVIDVARLVEVVGDDEVRVLLTGQLCKEHRRRRASELVDDNHTVALACQHSLDGVAAQGLVEYVTQL